jgi:hypothetical protein
VAAWQDEDVVAVPCAVGARIYEGQWIAVEF